MSPDTLPALRPMSRRQMLREASLGFGSIALTALLAEKSWAGSTGLSATRLIHRIIGPRPGM